MKTINNNLSLHLGQEVTTLCTLVKITRKDGITIGLTDHDQDVLFESVTYHASGSFTPQSMSHSQALNVDEGAIEAVFSSEFITQEAVLSGQYDHAEITLMMVNYQSPADGSLILRYGH